MREFFNTNGLFDILGWTKRKEYIKKPANDEWAENQSVAAKELLWVGSNLISYDSYKRKDKTPT